MDESLATYKCPFLSKLAVVVGRQGHNDFSTGVHEETVSKGCINRSQV